MLRLWRVLWRLPRLWWLRAMWRLLRMRTGLWRCVHGWALHAMRLRGQLWLWMSRRRLRERRLHALLGSLWAKLPRLRALWALWSLWQWLQPSMWCTGSRQPHLRRRE